MDATILVPALFVVTLVAVIIFAMASAKKTRERRSDPDATKSTLASDAPATSN